MTADQSVQAWNNFVLLSRPGAHEKGSARWLAAIAKDFMGQACNGGLNSFLTYSYDTNAREIVNVLNSIGAVRSALQLTSILDQLGRPLPASSAEERWKVMEDCWSERLEAFDSLTAAAHIELMAVLEAHVEADQRFYLGLGATDA